MTNKPKVTCKWLDKDQVLINPDGQVFPCCYLANTGLHYTSGIRNIDNVSGDWNKPVLIDYIKRKEQFNLNKRNIKEILDDDWFNKDLPKSWESRKEIPFVCEKFCDES